MIRRAATRLWIVGKHQNSPEDLRNHFRPQPTEIIDGVFNATLGVSHQAGGQPSTAVASTSTYLYNFLYKTGGGTVRTMSYSESRARYAETLDAVTNDHEEVVVTRAGHDPVVIVSLDDYQSLKETAYLLRSPENARRLVTSIERLEEGQGIQRDLAE